MIMNKGYTQLYTGNGKGKTTAALGLALRAAGAGLKTIIIQFMKGQHYSEIDSIKMLNGMVVIEQYGSPDFCRLDDDNIQEHYQNAKNALTRSKEAIADRKFDIVILDEIITALLFKLISLNDIVELIKNKPKETELVITGRGAPKSLFEHCDLITEMKEIKHYYTDGVAAREGIEN